MVPVSSLVSKFNRRLAGWQDFGFYDFVRVNNIDYYVVRYFIKPISVKNINDNIINARGVVELTTDEDVDIEKKVIYRTVYYVFEYDKETDDFVINQTSILQMSKREIFNKNIAGVRSINLKIKEGLEYYSMYIDIPEIDIDEWVEEVEVECIGIFTTEKPINNMYPLEQKKLKLFFKWNTKLDNFVLRFYVFNGRKYKKGGIL